MQQAVPKTAPETSLEAEHSSETHREFKQILTFALDKELYGVDITYVREVLEYCEVTRVPRCPSFMAGVINLRGHVVPVIDLRIEFGMDSRAPDLDTCIIIFEFVSDESQIILMGCIVDAVNEVVEISAEQLGAVPALGNKIDHSFIEAMAKVNDQFVIVLEISQVLSQDQVTLFDPELLQSAADSSAPAAN